MTHLLAGALGGPLLLASLVCATWGPAPKSRHPFSLLVAAGFTALFLALSALLLASGWTGPERLLALGMGCLCCNATLWLLRGEGGGGGGGDEEPVPEDPDPSDEIDFEELARQLDEVSRRQPALR